MHLSYAVICVIGNKAILVLQFPANSSSKLHIYNGSDWGFRFCTRRFLHPD